MPSTIVEAITLEELHHLKQVLACELVIKGEASEEKYNATIDRWNKAYIEKAVGHILLRPPLF
jgi:hypothetical protein